MARRIRSHYDILGQRWTVGYQKNLIREESALGQTAKLYHRILLDPDQGGESLLDTFTHELFHAVLSTSNNAGIDAETEERVIRAWTPGWIYLLRKNPRWW